ncbi:MAG: glycosyltransferase [Nitrospirae bacterium]|nr:glycosyltransferase [Nitrospirota bacterium]
MRGKPFFSVIINSYNYGRFIEEAIDSVLAQRFPLDEIEIIVVDDGSTDDTSVRTKKYADSIVYIFKENGGQASALNAGFAAARGEIIAFLDSDDYWHPSKLFEISGEFRRSPSVDFVYHYMDVVDNDRNLIDRLSFPDFGSGDFLEAYLRGRLPVFSPTSGMSFRKACLERIMPLAEEFRVFADIHMHYMLPFYIRGMSVIKKSLGYYRMHGGNLSGGNLLTAEKLGRERDIILRNMVHVESLAGSLGLDCRFLIQRLQAMSKIYGIYILRARGQRWAAFTAALRFNDFLPEDGPLYRLGRRTTLVIAAAVSPSLHLRLQRKYRIFRGIVSGGGRS